MAEVDLLDRYPRARRDIAARAAAVPAQREVAKRFGREYFDGDRGQGYGGYRYDGAGSRSRPACATSTAPARAIGSSTSDAPRGSSSTTCAA